MGFKVEGINFVGIDQFGFEKGRSARDAIGVLRNLGERSLQHGKDTFICFMGYEKAYDRVNWSKLSQILEKVGVDRRDRQLNRNLYLCQSVTVRIAGEYSGECKLDRGVRQGCPLSPLLFNIYIQALMNEALENSGQMV